MSGQRRGPGDITYLVNPPVTNEELNGLFGAVWPEHSWRDFSNVVERSLVFVCAYRAGRLIGFVNLAWDGGLHAFLLDTMVHPQYRGRGIGRQLVRRAAAIARSRGVRWLHVDFEPGLGEFYKRCGFRATGAGILRLEAGKDV